MNGEKLNKNVARKYTKKLEKYFPSLRKSSPVRIISSNKELLGGDISLMRSKELVKLPQAIDLAFTEHFYREYSTVRPLLTVSRFEIGKFCTFWQLPIYPDKSNQKINFLRNRVRKQLLPAIKLFFNSQIENVLLQFAEIIENENCYMNQITNKLLNRFIQVNPKPQFFKREILFSPIPRLLLSDNFLLSSIICPDHFRKCNYHAFFSQDIRPHLESSLLCSCIFFEYEAKHPKHAQQVKSLYPEIFRSKTYVDEEENLIKTFSKKEIPLYYSNRSSVLWNKINELFTDAENKWEEFFFFPKKSAMLESIADKKYGRRRLSNDISPQVIEICQFFTRKILSFSVQSKGEKRRSLFYLLCTGGSYSKMENLFCWNYFLRHNKSTEGINFTNPPSPMRMRRHITSAKQGDRHIFLQSLSPTVICQQDLFSIPDKPITLESPAVASQARRVLSTGDMPMGRIKTLVTKKNDNEKKKTTFQTISKQGSFSVRAKQRRCKKFPSLRACEAAAGDMSSELLSTSRSINLKKATDDLLKRGENINTLPSLVLFPRWSKPIGISMWVWNRRLSMLNKCSYNVRTERECVLLGTCTKALISENLPITFGDKDSPASINPLLLPGETKTEHIFQKHITEGNIKKLKNSCSKGSITFCDISSWKNTTWYKRWKEKNTLFNESRNLLVDQQQTTEGKVQSRHLGIKDAQNLLPSVICPNIFLKASLLCSCSFFGCFALHPIDQKYSKRTQQVTSLRPRIIKSKNEADEGTSLIKKVSFQDDPFAHTFFLYFNTFEEDKKELYWPIIVSYFPKALQRRVVKLFLMQQNWKKIRYSQIENFLKLKRVNSITMM